MDIFRIGPALLVLCSVAHGSQAMSNGPLRFEPNVGQTDSEVAFLARGAGHTLFLTPGAAVLRAGASVLKMNLIGANLSAEASALEPLDTIAHYLIGNEQGGWHTKV